MGDLFGAVVNIACWAGPEVSNKYRTVLGNTLGDAAFECQNMAKENAPVLTGRLRGSIAAVQPGTDLMVYQHEEPHDQGTSHEECRLIGQTMQIAVGAFTPYAHREEVTRGAHFLMSAYEQTLGEIPGLLHRNAAEIGEVGCGGGGGNIAAGFEGGGAPPQ